MGMFDYIVCNYPLPNYPLDAATAVEFQTKDTDEQLCSTYTISAAGYLYLADKLQDYTGSIHFYASNMVASGPGCYTRDGEDHFWLSYTALFVHGQLTHIERIDYRTEPAQKSSTRWNKHAPDGATPEERSKWWADERAAFEVWQAEELKRRGTK